jgi:hypothetical protein
MNAPVPNIRMAAPTSDTMSFAELRGRIEHVIERLIYVLDALDAPTEYLEDAQEDFDGVGFFNRSVDDEPSLGSVAMDCGWRDSQERWAAGTTDDCEDEHDGTEPSEDLEPSLGAPERHPQPTVDGGYIPSIAHTQELWAQGVDDDEDHDDYETEEDSWFNPLT